jgi:dihydrolipoamide dehydrogenase
LETSLKQIGMKFFLNRRENSVTQLNNSSQNVTLNDGTVINADSVLVATKRTPNLSGFKPIKLQLKDNFIFVNEKYETSVKNVYAIGDLIPGKLLTHKAQAGAVAEILAGFKPKKVYYNSSLYIT